MEKKRFNLFKLLLFLVYPYDSTEKYSNPSHANMHAIYPVDIDYFSKYIGSVKALFWIIAAVIIAMVLSQLN